MVSNYAEYAVMTTRRYGIAAMIATICLASGCHHVPKQGEEKVAPIREMGGNATGTDSPNSEFGKFDKPNP